MKIIKPIWLAGSESTTISVVKKDGKYILVSYGGQVELTRKEANTIKAITSQNSWQEY